MRRKGLLASTLLNPHHWRISMDAEHALAPAGNSISAGVALIRILWQAKPQHDDPNEGRG